MHEQLWLTLRQGLDLGRGHGQGSMLGYLEEALRSWCLHKGGDLHE